MIIFQTCPNKIDVLFNLIKLTYLGCVIYGSEIFRRIFLGHLLTAMLTFDPFSITSINVAASNVQMYRKFNETNPENFIDFHICELYLPYI